MTNNIPNNLPPTRLPLPQERAVYTRLSTDYYPWTEVLADLEARQGPEFSAVLDVQQDDRWARFVWVRGEARGGVAANGSAVPLEVILRGLPKAQVSLLEVDPLVADIVWNCRAVTAQPLGATWPGGYDLLTRQHFQGALLSDQHCSFWEAGRVVTGTLPTSGRPCLVVAAPAPARANSRAMLDFWRELLALTQRANPAFSETWRQVGVELSGEHSVLDPFANEVRVVNGALQVDRDVDLQELLPALLAAYQATLRRLGLRLADLNVGSLRQQEAWALSGLERSGQENA